MSPKPRPSPDDTNWRNNKPIRVGVRILCVLIVFGGIGGIALGALSLIQALPLSPVDSYGLQTLLLWFGVGLVGLSSSALIIASEFAMRMTLTVRPTVASALFFCVFLGALVAYPLHRFAF